MQNEIFLPSTQKKAFVFCMRIEKTLGVPRNFFEGYLSSA